MKIETTLIALIQIINIQRFDEQKLKIPNINQNKHSLAPFPPMCCVQLPLSKALAPALNNSKATSLTGPLELKGLGWATASPISSQSVTLGRDTTL